jgi:ABC-type Fe2+-enterobactin transport system substrate-binding protein
MNANTKKISANSQYLEELGTVVGRVGKDVQESRKLVTKVDIEKLDKKEYDETIEKVQESMRIMKTALKDNFSQLLATDNYLEKYLPFRIQNMISQNVLAIADISKIT